MEKYAAQIDENNIVINVIVVDSPELAKKLFGGNWVETKQKTDKNYATIGGLYHPDKDNFSGFKPYDYKGVICDSYILDDNCNWKTKEDKPKDILNKDEKYEWDEEKQKWEKVKIDKDGFYCPDCI